MRIAAIQIVEKRRRCTDRAVREMNQFVVILRRQVRPLQGVVQMVSSLVERSASDVKKAGKFARPIAAETFGNVSWRRGSGIANLLAELEILPRRAVRSECKDLTLKLEGKPPCVKIFESSDRHAELRA